MARSVCTADCTALEGILGQTDVGRFKGDCCCGCRTPVFKKLPAFLLFLGIWLAIVINMATVLSAPVGDEFSHFENVSAGLWKGSKYVNWIPDGRLVRSSTYPSVCMGMCTNDTTCKAYLMMATTKYSSYDDCYLSSSLPDASTVKTCEFECTTYVKSTTDPTPPSSAFGFESPFTPVNQGCSQPLSYGLHLCIIMSTVVFVVYWFFFTLSVPSRIPFRLLFFFTMLGSLICGAFIASWVANERVCAPSPYSYSSSYEVRVLPQIDLFNAAIASCVCLILMGVWPALMLPWSTAGVVVHSIIIGIYCLIVQADFGKIWTYFILLEWLIWQKDEYELESAQKAPAVGPFTINNNNAQSNNNAQNDNGRARVELVQASRNQNLESTAVIRSLEQALEQEKTTSAGLRREVERLRQEIATLSLGSKPIVYPPSSYNAGPPSSSYNAVPPPGSSPPYEPSPGFTPVASPGFSPVGYTPSPAYNPYNPASSPSAFPASSPYPASSPSYESGYSSSYGDNNASSVYPTATTTSHSEDPAPSTYSSSYL